MLLKIEDYHLSDLAKKEFKGKSKYPTEVIKIFKRRIFQIRSAKNSNDLRTISGLHLEKLKSKEYKDKYSVRINKAYRLIFRIEDEKISGLEIICIEDMNNHYS